MKTHQNKPIEEILKTSFDHKNYPCDIVIVGDLEKPMTSARFRTIQNYKAKIEAELKIKVGICNFLITGPAHLPDSITKNV